jgi:hypothetical protein
MMSTDSTITLVNRSSDVSTPRPRYPVSLIAVSALTCGAFGLSLAATVIEMINVQRAKDHWSGEQAVEIGMEWQYGALTFRESINALQLYALGERLAHVGTSHAGLACGFALVNLDLPGASRRASEWRGKYTGPEDCISSSSNR